MKRTIILLLTLILCFIPFGCENSQTRKTSESNPVPDNPDGDFASVRETISGHEYTYHVSRKTMYNQLKKEYGVSALIDMIDEFLLSELKNEAGISWIKSVTDAEIDKKINEECYGSESTGDDGSTINLTEEEKKEKEEKFKRTMCVSYGCNNEEAIRNKYRLSVARKKYAESKLIEKIVKTNEEYREYEAMSDTDKEKKGKDKAHAPYYDDDEFAGAYSDNQDREYTAIVVSFLTKFIARDALKAVGVKVNNGKWCNEAGDPLDSEAVKTCFQNLYKLVYGFLGEPEFGVEGGLLYKEKDLASDIGNHLKNMENGDYTVEPFEAEGGKLHCYLLKLGEKEIREFKDLTDEEKEEARKEYEPKLREKTLTASYVIDEMKALRREKEITVYDAFLKIGYLADDPEYKEGKATIEDIEGAVVSVMGKKFIAEDLFARMLGLGAAGVLIDQLVAARMLGNPDLNKYYDSDTDIWKDEETKREIENSLREIKEKFKDGVFIGDGYDPSACSWATFTVGTYGADNNEDLKKILLLKKIMSDITDDANPLESCRYIKGEDGKEKPEFMMPITEAEVSPLWVNIDRGMQKKVKDYFKVKGIHLLISAFEEPKDYLDGNLGINPLTDDKWTENRKQKAKALAEEVKAYLEHVKGTNENKLENIVKAYKAAPVRVSDNPLCVLKSEDGEITINLSSYKAEGLYLKWESLGKFLNGSMTTEFNDAVKEIWDKDIKDIKDDNDKTEKITITDPIETKFGYHVYINQTSYKLSGIKEEESTRYLPTLEEIRDNIEGKELKPGVKEAITKYYENYRKELKDENYISAVQYRKIALLPLTFETNAPVSEEDVKNFIDYYVDYIFESNLRYVTKDFLE